MAAQIDAIFCQEKDFDMKCPKCGSDDISVQAVTEVFEKRKKGCAYWIVIGWWWEIISWIVFGIWKLLVVLFGKKTKVVSKTGSVAVCQNCGHRWKVKA